MRISGEQGQRAATCGAPTGMPAAASALECALGYAFAAASGLAVAAQSGINATLGAHIGQAAAAAVSFITGLLCCLAFFAIDVTVRHAPLPTAATLSAAPAWSWIGGPLGALFIIATIVFAPRLGAGSFLAVFVSVQLASAVALDLVGAAGYVRRAVSWQRLLGVVLMAAGVALVTIFPGEPVNKDAPWAVGRALTHLYRAGSPGPMGPRPGLGAAGEGPNAVA